MENFPFVSVIIPCRDEVEYIGMALDSVIENDYPKDNLEIFVVDGMSVDGTLKVIEKYIREYKYIHLLRNPKKIQSAALNIAIDHAKGDVIMRLDTHSTYEPKYILKCVQSLKSYDADNVGGIWNIVPRTNSFFGKSIAKALSHAFGVGNAYYRFSEGENVRWVDTVPYFCVKRETIEQIGPFNERVGPSEDMDFNSRLRKFGGHILLDRDISINYHARSDMKSFLAHNWRNGEWAVLPFVYSDGFPVAGRHLVPLLFVILVFLFGGLFAVRPSNWWLFAGTISTYGLLNILATVSVVWKEKNPLYLITMPVVFTLLHLSYGAGSLWGLVIVGAMTLRKLFFGENPNHSEVWERVHLAPSFRMSSPQRDASAPGNLPFISVIIPCRDEVQYIETCLKSVVGNDYPMDRIEIFVIDGMSQDGTRDVIRRFVEDYDNMKLVDNYKKNQPAALNLGISMAEGDIIMQMDAHASYDKKYIYKCVRAMDDFGADIVGGIWNILPRSNSFLARCIARSLSHPFGVGYANYRIFGSDLVQWVETVPYFCARKECFEKIGMFNEAAGPTHDLEFKNRLRNAGGNILLVRDIVINYYARTDIFSFLRHTWRNGVWTIRPFLHSTVIPVSMRHLVPLFFMLAIIGTIGFSLTEKFSFWIFLFIVGIYGGVNLLVSIQVALKERDFRFLVAMPGIFGSLHVVYGLGSLWGLTQILWGKLQFSVKT
ncbi:glycosyltransferase family 2 protein [Nitrospinota bacterium]